ncbi:uncharacterized protein LOC128667304 [Microplitis demolitor]|uniref:uncharacterized protein LOC128667304 n=1 Tax=Microplitis demolitor TaxID=69319 RepID=UPI00235B61A5|nr:uncharacterized protein LOC128667304 [Microplitis demolitor]
MIEPINDSLNSQDSMVFECNDDDIDTEVAIEEVSQDLVDSSSDSNADKITHVEKKMKHSDEPKLERKLWPPNITETFVELVEKYQKDLESYKKKHVWEKISEKINNQYQSKITAQQCETKWKSVVRKYKEIKRINSTSGQSRKKWDLYDKVDAIMFMKPEIEPVAICSNKQGLVINKNTNSTSDDGASCSYKTDHESFDDSNDKEYESSFSKKRRKSITPTERRHKEKLERMDKYNDLFAGLIRAIGKTSNNKRRRRTSSSSSSSSD